MLRRCITTWVCFTLAMALIGCADRPNTERDEFASISVEMPTALPAILTIEELQARLTITGADMETITRTWEVGTRPASGASREFTIDGIPVGNNRTVTAEVLWNGVVYFDGSSVVNLVAGGNNRVSINLREVFDDGGPGEDLFEELIGTWYLTNTENAGLFIEFVGDNTFVATWDFVTFVFGVFTLLGNNIVLEFEDGSIARGTVAIDGDIMTITALNGVVEIYEFVE